MSRFLHQALNYHRRYGFCIIAIGTGKKAAVPWKRYQTKRPEEKAIRRMFTMPGLSGLAVILGDVSGGLCCRDFDRLDAYERWASMQPDLAANLPTVATARGRHVYFTGNVGRIIKQADGELRGAGYCLLPDSSHPDGKTTYVWTRPLPDGPLPSILNPSAVGLAKGYLEESTTNKPLPMASVGSVLSALSVVSVNQGCRLEVGTIDDAIHLTLPTNVGERNRCILDLARALKFNLGMAKVDPQTLRETVRAWHRAALPVIGTKPFDLTWFDFLRAWEQANYALGDGIMAQALQRAMTATPAPSIVARYEDGRIRLLVCICRELQRATGAGPFYLAARTAGRLLEVDHVTAWHWLRGLERDGVLESIERGGRGAMARKATRYRYLKD